MPDSVGVEETGVSWYRNSMSMVETLPNSKLRALGYAKNSDMHWDDKSRDFITIDLDVAPGDLSPIPRS